MSTSNLIMSVSIPKPMVVVGGGITMGILATFLQRRVDAIGKRFFPNSPSLTIGLLINKSTPALIHQSLYNTAISLQRKIGPIYRGVIQRSSLHFLERIFAPIFEEVVFRYGMQKAFVLSMVVLGIPETIAKVIAIYTISFLFSLTHQPVIESMEASEIFIVGVILGAIKEFSGSTFLARYGADGLVEAIIAHAGYNSLSDVVPVIPYGVDGRSQPDES